MESTYFADRAAEFFDRPKDRARHPFALVVSFYEPHSPFQFPDEWAGRYRPDEFPVPPVSEADRLDQPKVFADLTPDEMQGIQAAYYTSLSFLDHQVGRVLDALDASGLADDTIVVYLGDNGYMLGQHGRFEKHCFYEPAVRVPLIVRWPGHLPADRRVTDLVELVDVLPTLLDLAGQPMPPDLHGRSLGPGPGRARGEGARRGRQRVPGERGGDGPIGALQADRRHRGPPSPGRLRDRQPLPGPYERLYDLEADPERDDRPPRPPRTRPRSHRGLRRQLHDRLVTTRGARTPVPPGLSETEAIRWCLVPQDNGETPRWVPRNSSSGEGRMSGTAPRAAGITALFCTLEAVAYFASCPLTTRSA